MSESIGVTHLGLNSITPKNLPSFELTAVNVIFLKYSVFVYVGGLLVDHVVPL